MQTLRPGEQVGSPPFTTLSPGRREAQQLQVTRGGPRFARCVALDLMQNRSVANRCVDDHPKLIAQPSSPDRPAWCQSSLPTILRHTKSGLLAKVRYFAIIGSAGTAKLFLARSLMAQLFIPSLCSSSYPTQLSHTLQAIALCFTSLYSFA